MGCILKSLVKFGWLVKSRSIHQALRKVFQHICWFCACWRQLENFEVVYVPGAEPFKIFNINNFCSLYFS